MLGGVKKLEVMRQGSDPRAESIKKELLEDLGIELDRVWTKKTYLLDTQLTIDELETARQEIFTDPQVETSSFSTIKIPADYMIHVAWKPGTKDSVGEVAVEALEDLLNRPLKESEKVFSSLQIGIQGKVTEEQVKQIASYYANKTVQDSDTWTVEEHEFIVPRVEMDFKPRVEYIDLEVIDEELSRISKEGSLALNLTEMKVIQEYFRKPEVIAKRKEQGLKAMPLDAELESIAQTWSEHCKHKIFNSLITDVKGNIFEGIPNQEQALEEIIRNGGTRESVNSLFKTYIKESAFELKERFSWILSVLVDNSGVVEFDKDHVYTLKGESHNSPSKVEPYGGAYTGIVGVYRDPAGTGLFYKLIFGYLAFHTGDPDYNGHLNPELHPRQILKGVDRGVKDGGNCSGIPTIGHLVYFDNGFIGKPFIGVGASSFGPKYVNGKPTWEKEINPGDLAVIVGGRVGIDGIHGATESSLEGSKQISAGHVQIGDAYTQKKVMDFLRDARNKGLIYGMQDLGAGGINSALGELAEFTNGITIDLAKEPTKYHGLMPWQILVSESQERMALATKTGCLEELIALAEDHDVKLRTLGEFNDSGVFHVTYNDMECAYINMELLHNLVPQKKLKARWETPEERVLSEPVIKISDYNKILSRLLSSPNIASHNWVVRNKDHEVQGGSVGKPLEGVYEDVHADATVMRPDLNSARGIAFSIADNPDYGTIDTYHMVRVNTDEVIRRAFAKGLTPKEDGTYQIPLNDNFGWPNPIPSKSNPEAEYRTAQLWRAVKGLADISREYQAPLISGKDSMSMNGLIPINEGGVERVSAPPIVQMTAAPLIMDTRYCLSSDVKKSGDLVYLLGETKDELGGSALYKLFSETGLNVPKVDSETNMQLYHSHARAVQESLIMSSHGVYRGGLFTHLALPAIAGNLGLKIDLAKVPTSLTKDWQILGSESTGRLVVTIDPKNKEQFEEYMQGNAYACIGEVTSERQLQVYGVNGDLIINKTISELRSDYHSTYDSDLMISEKHPLSVGELNG